MTTAFTLLFWLIFGHAVADYPLQGDFLSKAKNHRAALPGVPWYQGLIWHAVIQGGIVALVLVAFHVPHAELWGMGEFVVHCVIDYAKCQGWTRFNADQALHVACKVALVVLVAV